MEQTPSSGFTGNRFHRFLLAGEGLPLIDVDVVGNMFYRLSLTYTQIIFHNGGGDSNDGSGCQKHSNIVDCNICGDDCSSDTGDDCYQYYPEWWWCSGGNNG